jgi:hypothetical protein
MEQSSQNENVIRIENEFCEILSNEVSMEEDPLVESSKENPTLQTKTSSIYEKMQVNFEKLDAQKVF